MEKEPDHSYIQCTPQGCEFHIPHDFFSRGAWDKWFSRTPAEPIEMDEAHFYALLTGQEVNEMLPSTVVGDGAGYDHGMPNIMVPKSVVEKMRTED